MLTHFQNLDLSFLKFNILHGHFFLRHYFDSHLFTSLLMDSRFDETKLTFTNGLFELVVVEKICVTNYFFDDVHPPLFVFLIKKVIRSWFVSWEDERKWIECCLLIQMLFRIVVDEHAYKVVHTLVLFFSLVLVNVQFFSKKTVPIFFEFAFACFTNHFTFELNAIIVSKCYEIVKPW